MNAMIAQFTGRLTRPEPRGYCDVGDMTLFCDGDGWILAVVFAKRVYHRGTRFTITLSWGDTVRTVRGRHDRRDVLAVTRCMVRPEAGRYIGRRFASVEEAQEALRPYMWPEYAAWLARSGQ